jgi:L-aspartate oxidase
MREIHDVIIIGTGIAGLTAAIYLKEKGLDVLVITKNDVISETNTNYAQGGIIAWKETDSPEKLADDIFKAGYHYNNIDAVNKLAEKGPKLVFDFLIDRLDIPFIKSSDGSIDYAGEAAHSERRIVHYKDHTGEKIQEYLINYAKKIDIPI